MILLLDLILEQMLVFGVNIDATSILSNFEEKYVTELAAGFLLCGVKKATPAGKQPLKQHFKTEHMKTL